MQNLGHPEGDSRFTGVRLNEVMVLECFSGTGRLTRAVKDLGMAAMAVDKDSKRAQSVHVANYDLNDPDQVAALSHFIKKSITASSFGCTLHPHVVQPHVREGDLCRSWLRWESESHSPFAVMTGQASTRSRRKVPTSPMTALWNSCGCVSNSR